MASASDSDTEGEPIAVQKKCQNTDLVSGDCSATSVADTHFRGRERGEKSSMCLMLPTCNFSGGERQEAQSCWKAQPG